MARGPATTDLISQLQSEVNGLCAKLFNFLGALQRDAPPQSVKSEGLLAPAGGVDVEAQTELMANELLESFRLMESLIQRVPPTDLSEEQQVAELVTLQRANADASAALRTELAAAEGRLTQLQDAYALLADLQLAARRQRQQKGAVAGPPAGVAAEAGLAAMPPR